MPLLLRAVPQLGRRAVLVAGGIALAAPAFAQQVVNNVLVGRDGWLFSNFGEPQRTLPPAVDKATADLVVEAMGLLRAARIEPVAVLIPSKNRLYRQHTGVTAAPPPEWVRRYATILAELRRNNTIAPDLEGAMRRAIAERPAEGLYLRADTHWTPRGAEVAATEVARAVREAGRLPASPRPGTQLAAPSTGTHPFGDLQRLLPPEQRGQFRPEEFQVRLPQQGGGASLLDDAPADVAAIGSSFLEPRFNYVASLSNQLNRPVFLHWRPNTVGPWATLLEYVRSPDFARARPRMLLWHHLEIDMASGPNSSGWGQNMMTPQAFLAELRTRLGA